MKNETGRKKFAGIIPMVTGLLLIAAALLLVMYNKMDADFAEEEANYYEEQLRAAMETYAPEPEVEETVDIMEQSIFETEAEEEPVPEMPLIAINGLDCIGILHVPKYSLNLPILFDCDMELLRKSPCRYSGSYYTNDLVICGHNYRKHFSLIKYLEIGETLSLETVDGTVITYQVANIEQLKPTEVERMVSNMDGQWDLTLFTCTTGGNARWAIRCMRMEE